MRRAVTLTDGGASGLISKWPLWLVLVYLKKGLFRSGLKNKICAGAARSGGFDGAATKEGKAQAQRVKLVPDADTSVGLCVLVHL